MNIVIFDTETTSLEKPFCYNIGYVIGNEHGETLMKRNFVVEQIWHNLPLFSSAYYADKRALYVDAMRARLAVLDKFGYICQQMKRDFRNFSVERAFAYNSPFDEKVFDFNCDWFKCNNPFEDLPIIDIRGFVHSIMIDKHFLAFCDNYGYYTESGNYSTTAETIYRYITNNTEFIEEHTALADSIIEYEILMTCVRMGADINSEYNIRRSIERIVERELHIRTAEQTDYYFKYNKIRINKDKTEITLK